MEAGLGGARGDLVQRVALEGLNLEIDPVIIRDHPTLVGTALEIALKRLDVTT